MFTVTYSKPEPETESYYVEQDDELPYTEEMDASSFVATMEQLTNYMIDSQMEEE